MPKRLLPIRHSLGLVLLAVALAPGLGCEPECQGDADCIECTEYCHPGTKTCEITAMFECPVTSAAPHRCVHSLDECMCTEECDLCEAPCDRGSGRCAPSPVGHQRCPDGSCRAAADSCEACTPACDSCSQVCRDGVCRHNQSRVRCPDGSCRTFLTGDPYPCTDDCAHCDPCLHICKPGGICEFPDDPITKRCADGRCVHIRDDC